MVFTRQDAGSLEDRDAFDHSRLPLYIQIKYSDDYVLARCCLDHQISNYVREVSQDQLLTEAIEKIESKVRSYTTHRRVAAARQALITELIDGPHLLAMTSLGPPRMLTRAYTWSRRAQLIALAGFLALVGGIVALAVLIPGMHTNPPATSGASGQSLAVAELLQNGQHAMAAGNATNARLDFLQAIKIDPLDSFAYYNLGVLYQQSSQPSIAATAYGDALLINGNFPQALFNLAIIDSSSDPSTALALYQKLVKLQPRNASAQFNLGLLLAKQGDKPAGQAELAKAVALNSALASRVPKDLLPLP